MNARTINRIIELGLIAAAVRVSSFWFLFTMRAMRRESYAELLLIVLLYPEGLIVPKDVSWTLWRGLEFSFALVVGTALMTAVVAGLVRALQLLSW
jgi:hypothetical protein